jgi:L-proline amide hydrolase
MKIDLDRRHWVHAMAWGSVTFLSPATLSFAAAPIWEPPPPDVEKRVKVRGGSVYVRVNGNLAGPKSPVIIAHGGPGGNHADFLAAIALADERAVILYDQLDSGLSDQPNNPRNWTVERFVSEIDAIRAVFDLDELHVVGHSWGSALAMQYAARQPAGLKSITLGGPYFSTRSWEASTLAELATLPKPVQDVICTHESAGTTEDPAYREAIAVYYKKYFQRHAQLAYVTKYQAQTGIKPASVVSNGMWGPSEIRGTSLLRNYDGEALLGQINVPTLVMCGEFDEMSPAAAAPFVRRIRNARLVTIRDSGHMMPLDEPAMYVRTIRAHLAQTDKASRSGI